jgi:thioredoxin-dependent peroxiredoxin
MENFYETLTSNEITILFGKGFMGILRTTFIIDPDQKIVDVTGKVNTKTHHEDVLKLTAEN